MLLQRREALGLTPDQVNRLEALEEEARESSAPHMRPAMQAHMDATELLRGDSPDLEGYEAQLREAADHMVQAHVAMARVAVEARAVLTPEQLDSLGELGGGGMMGGAGGAHHRMGGNQDGMGPTPGGMGHDTMMGMMGCMMMGMGGGV